MTHDMIHRMSFDLENTFSHPMDLLSFQLDNLINLHYGTCFYLFMNDQVVLSVSVHAISAYPGHFSPQILTCSSVENNTNFGNIIAFITQLRRRKYHLFLSNYKIRMHSEQIKIGLMTFHFCEFTI